MTGIDASLSNAEAAERHSKLDPDLEGKVSYKCCLVEELAEEAGPSFDGLVASEILEHVADPKSFIQACCNLVVVSMAFNFRVFFLITVRLKALDV